MRQSLRDTLNSLAQIEDGFLGQRFLAPVLRGGGVRVRIAGIVCEMAVEPADIEGCGVFAPLSMSAARWERAATAGEWRKYLALFPSVALVLCEALDPQRRTWLALPAHRGDGRLDTSRPQRVQFVEEAGTFDTVRARFDGAQFWFDGVDPRVDAGAGAYLRQALAGELAPATLARSGLTGEQTAAYAFVIGARLRAREAKDRREREEAERAYRQSASGRIRLALAHAGAELRDVRERDGQYVVSYSVDGERHTSVVDGKSLQVRSSGICLSGRDGDFDLHSLVSVLREPRW